MCFAGNMDEIMAQVRGAGSVREMRRLLESADACGRCPETAGLNDNGRGRGAGVAGCSCGMGRRIRLSNRRNFALWSVGMEYDGKTVEEDPDPVALRQA